MLNMNYFSILNSIYIELIKILINKEIKFIYINIHYNKYYNIRLNIL